MPKRDLVEWANEEVSVFDVLEAYFNVHVPREGSSYKSYCPFRFEHSDGGIEKGFRTYPESNSGWCFIQHGRLTPVRLIALQKGWRYERAAVFLLEWKKLMHRPWTERWPEALAVLDAKPGTGSSQELAAALHETIQAHPNYPPGGLSPELEGAVARELSILDSMLMKDAANEEVSAWFSSAKSRLFEVLDQREAEVG